VLAKIEYETWFVAAAESLRDYLDITESVPDHPETSAGKGWVQARFRGTKYSETIDQVRMTAAMDLSRCREGSPSFDKLCREIAKYMLDAHMPT
jgi:hypothetical protein